MADRLIIAELEVACRLGVLERERESPQPVWIDLELAIDAARAARSDDVAKAVDYAALVESVKDVAQGRAYRLMETLAEAVAARVLEGYDTPRVRVQVRKRALAGIGYAAVEIRRAARRPRARRARPARVGRPARVLRAQ